MQAPEPFLIFIRKLNQLGIPHMVSGSVAAIFYGELRMTNAVDIIVLLKDSDIQRLTNAFPLEDFYCPPVEVIREEISRSQRGHFNIIHHDTGFKADIYPTSDDLHRWGLSKSQIIDFENEVITLAPPEYVIIRKLQFYREGGSQKHLRDINRMHVTLGDGWDSGTLLELVERHGLQSEWREALGFGQ